MRIKTKQISARKDGNILKVYVDETLAAQVFGGRTEPEYVYDVLWDHGYEIEGFEEAEKR